MEVAGFVIGAVGLATSFNNVLDCFEYVHISKAFGSKFQTSLLRLGSARLRLSRWGESMGLSGGVDDATALPFIKSGEERQQAEKILGKILVLFQKALETSAKYEEDGRTRAVYDEQTDLDLTTASLLEKMRRLSVKRQNRTSLSKKIKFALYDESHLKDLIEAITALTNDLVTLFPDTGNKEQQLCVDEVSVFSDNIRVLAEATTGQDQILADALSKILKPVENLHNYRNEKSVIGSQGAVSGGSVSQNVNIPS